MAIDKNDPLVVPVFKILTTKNEAKSREAGRPIFDDMEVVEVRFAGDRNKISVFPALAICGEVQDEDGNTARSPMPSAGASSTSASRQRPSRSRKARRSMNCRS
jgi:hypothetical protein